MTVVYRIGATTGFMRCTMRWTDLCFSRIYAIAFKRSPLRAASPARQLRAQARTSFCAVSFGRWSRGFFWPVILCDLRAFAGCMILCFCRIYAFLVRIFRSASAQCHPPPTVNPFWKAKILIITTGRPGKPAHLTMILPDHCVCHSDYLFMNDWSPCGSEVGVGWGPDTTVHGSGQVCNL